MEFSDAAKIDRIGWLPKIDDWKFYKVYNELEGELARLVEASVKAGRESITDAMRQEVIRRRDELVNLIRLFLLSCWQHKESVLPALDYQGPLLNRFSIWDPQDCFGLFRTCSNLTEILPAALSEIRQLASLFPVPPTITIRQGREDVDWCDCMSLAPFLKTVAREWGLPVY